MAILVECPICHNKQAEKNKKCKCGEDLVKAKKSKRVRYWVRYILPDGKRRKEYVGTSIDEARASDGKVKVAKKENRLLDILPENKITWKELAAWYLVEDKLAHFGIAGQQGESCIFEIEAYEYEGQWNAGIFYGSAEDQFKVEDWLNLDSFEFEEAGGKLTGSFSGAFVSDDQMEVVVEFEDVPWSDETF